MSEQYQQQKKSMEFDAAKCHPFPLQHFAVSGASSCWSDTVAQLEVFGSKEKTMAEQLSGGGGVSGVNLS